MTYPAQRVAQTSSREGDRGELSIVSVRSDAKMN